MAFSLYPSLGLFRGLVIRKVVLQGGARVSRSPSLGQPGTKLMAGPRPCVPQHTCWRLCIEKITLQRYLCAVLCLVAYSRPTHCDLMDCSPPGSSAHGDSPGKNTRVGCHALLRDIHKAGEFRVCLYSSKANVQQRNWLTNGKIYYHCSSHHAKLKEQ